MDKSYRPSFNFVNLTHPDELKDEETQLRIRRLAMTEVGKARRKPKTKRGKHEIVFELHNSPRGQQNRTDFDRFNGSSVDAFEAYPVELDEHMRALVVNIFRAKSNHSTLLRGSWWPVSISDPAAFYCTLSNSQLYIHMQLNGPFVNEDDAVSLSYHSKALQLVNEKMKDPAQHRSDALTGTVAAFMCHDYIIGALDRWEQHRQALLKIIELRGGIDSITREELRITLSWCDLAGAFSKDIPTRLPMPRQWKADSRSPPGSPRPFSQMALVWKQQLPMRQEWVSVFEDVNQLISLDRALSDKQIEAATTSGSWMEPTMVRLLSIRPLLQSSDQENIMEEVCRLGTLMFLAPIWRHMGANPVWTINFSRNLLEVLNTHRAEWNELKPFLVWAVYFAAIETRDTNERVQFNFMLAVLMRGMQMKEWEELLQLVKSVLWVEKIFGKSDDTIRDAVMGILVSTPIAGPMDDLSESNFFWEEEFPADA